MKRCISIMLIFALLIVVLAGCSSDDEKIPQAHIAENTTPLETDKFLDYPDFILYTKGDTTVKLSPELQAEVYATFEKCMQEVSYAYYPIMGFYDSSELVSMIRKNSIRFCYQQRRCFTGTFQSRPSNYPEGAFGDDFVGDPSYFWGNVVFDEVMFSSTRILFGLDGSYKSVNMSGDLLNYLTFWTKEDREVSFGNMHAIAKSALTS